MDLHLDFKKGRDFFSPFFISFAGFEGIGDGFKFKKGEPSPKLFIVIGLNFMVNFDKPFWV